MTRDDEFWSNVDRSRGPAACWPWKRGTDANGYGWLRWHGQRARAHRVALALDGRPPAPGQVARHLCNNMRCCNPAHLAIGTHRDNAQDRVAAGHQKCGKRDRLLDLVDQANLVRWYLRGLATSPELASLFHIAPERVRSIVSRSRPEGGA